MYNTRFVHCQFFNLHFYVLKCGNFVDLSYYQTFRYYTYYNSATYLSKKVLKMLMRKIFSIILQIVHVKYHVVCYHQRPALSGAQQQAAHIFRNPDSHLKGQETEREKAGKNVEQSLKERARSADLPCAQVVAEERKIVHGMPKARRELRIQMLQMPTQAAEKHLTRQFISWARGKRQLKATLLIFCDLTKCHVRVYDGDLRDT